MNTIYQINYGCTVLYTQECENLSGGFWPVVLRVIRYIINTTGIVEAIIECGPEFIEGFKEGWEAAKP